MVASSRKRVAVVGATGVAGQQFLVALAEHPWFEVTLLAASERSAGRRYADAIRSESGQLRWSCEEPLPAVFEDRVVESAAEMDLSQLDLVFSAVESDAARGLEERFAAVQATDSRLRLERSAVHRFALESERRARADMGWISAISVLGIVLLFLFSWLSF